MKKEMMEELIVNKTEELKRQQKLKFNSNFKIPKVLIVDDEPGIAKPINIIFFNLGWDTSCLFDGSSTVDKLYKNKFDLIILDWNLPDITGGEVLKEANLVRAYGTTPVVLYSKEVLNICELPKMDAFLLLDFWQKPLSYSQLTSRAAWLVKGFTKM